MSATSIALTFPLAGGIARGMRAVSATLVGGVVGLAAAVVAATPVAIPLFAGLVLGAAFGSSARPRQVESWVSRTVFALGIGALGGHLVTTGSPAWGWFTASCAMATAACGRDERIGPQMGRMAAMLGVTLMALVATAVVVPPLIWQWGPGHLLEILLWSGMLGGAVWIGSDIGVRVFRAQPPRPKALATPARPSRSSAPPLFAAEKQALEEAAGRIEGLATNLVRVAPEEVTFTDQIHESVSTTLSRAHEAIDRWRVAQVSAQADRSDLLRARIAVNENRLGSLSDGSMRRVVETTLERQRQTLSEFEAIDAARDGFALRLQQLESGLELLELTLERALTAGGAIDSTDVDAIVEAMGDVYDALGEELSTPTQRAS